MLEIKSNQNHLLYIQNHVKRMTTAASSYTVDRRLSNPLMRKLWSYSIINSSLLFIEELKKKFNFELNERWCQQVE